MTKLEVALSEVERINKEIAALTHEREIWNGVVSRETPRIPLSAVSPTAVAVAQPAVEDDDGDPEYGYKTLTMRRAVVGKPEGATMKELRAVASSINQEPNFVYRFINRMKRTGELESRNNRYFATEKMKSRLTVN